MCLKEVEFSCFRIFVRVPPFLSTIGYLEGFTETQCFLGLVPGDDRILTKQLNHPTLGCKEHIGQILLDVFLANNVKYLAEDHL